MKVASVLGFLAAAVLLAGPGWAEDQAPAPEKLMGAICKVDGAKISVKCDKTKKVVQIATDDQTTVTLDGKAAKVSDLKAGQKVVVTPATGTATRIEAKKGGG